MSIEVDVHPDDLLHRARRGRPLSRDEQLYLDAHLRDCSTCRFVGDAGRAFDSEPTESAPAQVDALVERTMRRLRSPARVGRALPRRLAAGAITVVGMIGGVAFAGYWGSRHPPPAHEVVAPRAPAPPAAVKHRAVTVAVPPVDPAPPSTAARSLVPASRRVALAPRSDDGETAAHLFGVANRARRQGDTASAEAAYDALWSKFRASPEAVASRAIAGQWMLDRGMLRAAIALFRQYLAAAVRGELEEDVLVGLADAHESNGDRAAAVAIWARLLAEHPRSVHAERAREGLRRLQAGSAR
jgi:TolA-binding protein